jgi:L-alanine-DL-glutamate epimerase-like enolase superfamily enzyme
VTGWLEAAALAHSFAIPFSAHCGPSIHAQAACAAPQISHTEFFHDHARIEHLLFDGALDPSGGCLRPDPTRPGLGLALKRQWTPVWVAPPMAAACVGAALSERVARRVLPITSAVTFL